MGVRDILKQVLSVRQRLKKKRRPHSAASRSISQGGRVNASFVVKKPPDALCLREAINKAKFCALH